MELDYIGNINEYGDSVVRLYNFDKAQAVKFRQAIEHIILTNKQHLDLSRLEFIEPRNCNLVLRISKTNEGIITLDNKIYYCFLTIDGYKNMVSLLKPYCEKETKGYKYLYDLDNLIDLLFSPAGSW